LHASSTPNIMQESGRLILAWNQKHWQELQENLHAMQSLCDVSGHMIERDAQAAYVNSNLYCGGCFFPAHATIQPTLFHYGLMQKFIAHGGQTRHHADVVAITGQRGNFMLALANAEPIHARQIIVCTNGYTSKALQWWRARVLAIPSYMIATQPLATPQHYIKSATALVETRSRHCYYRLSPDGTRIILGARASINNITPATATKRLRKLLTSIFPDLHDVEITHSWRGLTGFTYNMIPATGVQDGIHYAMGYCGGGVAFAPYLGDQIARVVMGDIALDDLVFAQTGFPPYPLHHAPQVWRFLGNLQYYMRDFGDFLAKPES
ncbi:MAG: FAD-binding oxidoreductase, partial [Pseudomonadota bacterium]